MKLINVKGWLKQLQELQHITFILNSNKEPVESIIDVFNEHYDKEFAGKILKRELEYPISIVDGNKGVYLHLFIDNKTSILMYQDKSLTKGYNQQYENLLQCAKFIYYTFNYEELDVSRWSQIGDKPIIETPKIEEEMIRIREEENYHSNYANEVYIKRCVKRGDTEQLRAAFDSFIAQGDKGVLAKKDTLRDKKNHIIPVVTLATRAAIEGGLSQEQAYVLSDLYIQRIEEKKDIDDVLTVSYHILMEFAKKVKQQKRKNLSKNIYLCQEYINHHLYEKISLQDIADALEVNYSYLSYKFKQETGMTLRHYIQVQKIEEAKTILLLSKYQVSEIYTLLNFTDQSHFIRVFKKIEGITPNQYKNIYLLK